MRLGTASKVSTAGRSAVGINTSGWSIPDRQEQCRGSGGSERYGHSRRIRAAAQLDRQIEVDCFTVQQWSYGLHSGMNS